MKNKFVFSFILSGILFTAAGCGGGKSLNSTDQKLTGQWIAEKLNAKGDRILLVFNEESITTSTTPVDDTPYNPYDKPDDKKDPHSVRIVAIRPAGDTFSVDLGVYEIEKNKILFDLTEIADFTSPYTVSAPTAEAPGQLTLGTEVYFKVTGSLDGPQLGGQIQISQAATDEGVTVSSVKTSSVAGPHQTRFVPGEILVGYHEDPEASDSEGGPEAQPSSTSALSIASVREKLAPMLATVSVENMVRSGGYRKIQLGTSSVAKLTALSVAAASPNLSDRVFPRLEAQDQLDKDTIEAIAKIKEDKRVKFAVRNAILGSASLSAPTDTFFADQWNLDAMNATDAWGAATPSGEIVVAVIDTGIVDHPDLTGHVLMDEGYDFVQASIPGISNLSLDGDGPDTDPTDPGDQQTGLGLPGGNSWHGTHIAGIIAANVDNAVGIAGVAPSVKILPLRSMGFEGNGTLDDVAQAIRYAAKLNNVGECTGWTLSNGVYSTDEGSWTCTIDAARPKAHIINMSLGALLDDLDATPLTEAVNDAAAAGVLVVAAAGNEASGPGPCTNSVGTTSPNCKFQPAANTNAVSVTAVYANLAFAAAYSNYGGDGSANTQFLAAPGGSGGSAILSTIHPSVLGGYAELMGTSQAAAHVSGVAALVWSDKPALTMDQVKEALKLSAVDLGDPGRDKYYGYGLVNACGALLKGRELAGSPTAIEGAIKLSSENADFGLLGTTHTVVISGGCGTVSGITATKHVNNGPSGWLGVTLTSGTTPSQLNFTINRTVDGTALPPGDYTATVTVNSPAGNVPINIAMKVGTTSTAGGSEVDNLRKEIEDFLSGGGSGFANEVDLGEVIVLLIDANAGSAAYYTKTDFTANYNFQFGGINPGSYYVLAGVDENLDGTICKEGETEPCFAYPSLANPEAIEVTATTKKNDLVLIY